MKTKMKVYAQMGDLFIFYLQGQVGFAYNRKTEWTGLLAPVWALLKLGNCYWKYETEGKEREIEIEQSIVSRKKKEVAMFERDHGTKYMTA